MRSTDRTPVAVIDIGSNSIRLVVYESASRAPMPLFNEKVLCGLGRGLDESGRLNEDGIAMALVALPRFVRVAREMGASRINMMATAAARDAENGPEFVRMVGEACDLDVEILSGEEEARLSGLGVLSGTPEAEGLMGDLGGGSVELVELNGGRTGRQATLPLGALRLDPKLIARPLKARDEIDRHLSNVPWLSSLKGRMFYPVGGAWRNLARLHMDYVGYPLHIIHQYRIPVSQALELLDLVAHQSPAALQSVPGISKRRVDTLPYAAMLLHRILTVSRPAEIVFSANGLREGALFDHLPESERQIDPLISCCTHYVDSEVPTAAVTGDELFDWMSPIFEGETESDRRLRKAACLLADIAKREHPDYRSEHALMRVIRLPVVGIGHEDRGFLAVAVASRHAQVDSSLSVMKAIKALLPQERIEAARTIGLAIRLAYTLTGGVSHLLARVGLAQRNGNLRLTLPEDMSSLDGAAVERRFQSLAKLLGLTPEIKIGQ